jgi:hypothetical protein
MHDTWRQRLAMELSRLAREMNVQGISSCQLRTHAIDRHNSAKDCPKRVWTVDEPRARG